MSEAVIRQQREYEARDREQRAADLRAIMDLPAGRRFMAATLLGPRALLDGSFVTGGLDGQRASDFNEGRKEFLRELLLEIQTEASDAAGQMVAGWFQELAMRKRTLASLAVPNRAESR